MAPLSELDRLLDALSGGNSISAHTAALRLCDEPAAIAGYLSAERAALIEKILAVRVPGEPAAGLAMAREFSELMDAVIVQLFAIACRRVGADPETAPIAIVATGGFGRKELCPFSDIDLTFIPARDGEPATDAIIREMFTLVMDVCIARCGLELGYAYRLLEDCGNLDHQTACGLLDSRLLTGSQRLFIRFEDAFWESFNATEFVFAKIDERSKTLAKLGKSPRVVEPHLKEGPGGLRDMQTAIWLAQARWHLTAAQVRGRRGLDALVRQGEITANDAELLFDAKEKLFQVRNALHALAGAERDQLVITRQEDVARVLGYSEQDSRRSNQKAAQAEERGGPPVERMMAKLFPALAAVRYLADQMMDRVGNSRLILGLGLDSKHRQIVPANGALNADDPSWLIWMCELAQKYQLTFSREIERAAVDLTYLRPSPGEHNQAGRSFLRLLSTPNHLYSTLQKMADLGILGWFVPEFARLMDLIPYDPSHDFTVGQHSLNIVKHLEALLTPECEEQSEMKQILLDLARPEQLMLAALLHDSGKAIPGTAHSVSGTAIARRVCARLEMDIEATENVCFLVENHLLMAETSRLRDLNLDETIAEFTRTVSDIERLNMLYLLTYADTRAVGEGVWTQVKGRFLRELWQRAMAVLCDEEPAEFDEAAIARARRRLLKDLSIENLPDDEVAEHIHSMPAQYLLNQTLQRIALHIGFVRRVRAGEVVVDFFHERDTTYSELTVCAMDDPTPGLLARIAGVLTACGINVHDAQVHTRASDQDRIALDRLLVDHRGRQLASGKAREVADCLQKVLSGALPLDELFHKRRTANAVLSSSSTPMSVSAGKQVAAGLTLVELMTADSAGAFYRMCDAFTRLGWHIHSARVSNWRGQSRAGFYVIAPTHLSEEQIRDAVFNAIASGGPA